MAFYGVVNNFYPPLRASDITSDSRTSPDHICSRLQPAQCTVGVCADILIQVRQARKKEFLVSINVKIDKRKIKQAHKACRCKKRYEDLQCVYLYPVLRHSAASPGHQIQCSHHTRIRSGAIAPCRGRSGGGMGAGGSSANKWPCAATSLLMAQPLYCHHH